MDLSQKITRQIWKLEEDFPQSFNREHFESLNSFAARKRYADEHLQKLGAGTGRVANSANDGYNDEGTVLEKWTLHNAWIKKIEFSELDYEGDDLTEVTVELRYDYAELNDTKVGAVYGTLDTSADREPTGLNGQYEVPFGDVPERQD